jgi:hypothetical protein
MTPAPTSPCDIPAAVDRNGAPRWEVRLPAARLEHAAP